MSKQLSKKTVLVDGDIILFRVTSALSKSFDFGGVFMHSCDIEEMKTRVREDINGIMNMLDVTSYIFCLSGEHNFRKKLFPTYKSNRKGTEKPEGYYEVKEWCLDNLNCKIESKLEADDIMGILGTQHPEDYIIFSQDKDLKTIPCEQWDFKTLGLWTPTEFEADKFLYTQILTGDVVDGYCGLVGCGKVAAEKILKDAEDSLDLLLMTLGAYFDYYGYGWIAVDQFVYQTGQARILRSPKEIEGWNPLTDIIKGKILW